MGAGGSLTSVPATVVVGFWRGLGYPFRGIRFVFVDHPGLVRFWIFPIVITFLVMGLVLAGIWHHHDGLFEALWAQPSGEGMGAGVARFFHGLVEILFVLLLLLVGLVAVILLSSLFAAPFNDLLSEEVERLATGRKGPPFRVKGLLLDLGRTLLFEAVYLVLVVALWLGSLLLPVLGQIVATALGFVLTGLYWAISYVDWPASRRRKSLGFRVTLALRHFWAMSGFGTGVWIVLFVPLLNLLFMPVAVAGGTLLYLDLEAQDARGSPAGESNRGAPRRS